MSTYDPLFYALVHQGTPGDLAFYLEACRGAARVLEMGCGYGRLSVPLVQAGAEVWGIDVHDGLLALAEQRLAELPAAQAARLHLLHADMRSPPHGPFDRVIIPFSGLYCLQSDEDVLRCLRAARAALSDDGALIFDGYGADGFHEECVPDDYPDDELEHVALIAVGGVAYDVLERSTWDRHAQRLTATYVHVPADGGAPIEHAIAQRYLLSAQIDALLHEAGFVRRARFGSFDKQPYEADSDVIIVLAAPAGHSGG